MSYKQLIFLSKRFRYEIIALVFTLYGIYLRFVCLLRRDLWIDELVPLDLMSKATRPFWHRFSYVDFTYFPGEYIINWPFVFLFGRNKLGISIPHILFTFLGFYFLYLLCKRYFNSIFAWIATFALVAIHRELIFHSFEFRPYAVLPALALAVLYLSEQVISSRYSLTLTQKILIGFFFIFTIIYHAYGAVILFFSITYFVLCESERRSFREIFNHSYRFLGIIIVIGLPLFLWYSIGTPSFIKATSYNVFEFIANPLTNFLAFSKTILGCLVGNKILYPLLIFLISPFLLPYSVRFKQIGFLFILVVLPIMVVFLPNILFGYWILQRQFVWVMPLFAFLIGWCIDSFVCFAQRKKIVYG